MDKTGQTIDFLLTEQRDRDAAPRFLTKAIRHHGMPEKITIVGSETNASAIRAYNEAHRTIIAIRQVRYLDNRWSKSIGLSSASPARCWGSIRSRLLTQYTLAGVELMHMLRKGQLEAGVEQGLTAAKQFYSLAA